jgi:D-arabinose 1-dehydrogenase-like Zn-dependent alcohol dehydrogenase
MKAFLMSAAKEPLAVRELPDPQPGPGQVRIRMRATGVCGTDVHVWHGELPVPLPMVLGHEPAGVVDLAGPGVESVKAGDRVGVSWFQGGCDRCVYCQKKEYKFCAAPKSWITNGGGYAEYMIAEAGGCTLLPEGLDWESAAPLFCGGFSAMSAYRSARPQGGDRIAIVGMGGLGHLALQVAKAFGHEVVMVTNSADKAGDARKLGADEVLVVKDHAGKELQAIGGANVVLSFSPSMKQNSELMEGLRAGGRLVTTAVSGEPIQADPVQMLFKQTSIIGSAHNNRADLIDVLQLAATGRVKPQLEIYKLDEINRVLTRLVDGKVRHRAVVSQDA